MQPTRNRRFKSIAIASGKGGVGKTNIAVNLSVGLALMGQHVMLFDADLGLANADILLGLRPTRTLHDLVAGRVEDLDEILVEGPGGLKLVPSASGIGAMANLTPAEHAGLIRAFSAYDKPLDVLVVDTAAGVQDSVTSFCRAVQAVFIVVCDEPASLTDAYALIKVLKTQHGVDRFQVCVNMAQDMKSAREMFVRLTDVCDHFLGGVSLDLAGVLPRDPGVHEAVVRQQPFCRCLPESPVCRGLEKMADTILRWEPAPSADGNIKFFWKKLLYR